MEEQKVSFTEEEQKHAEKFYSDNKELFDKISQREVEQDFKSIKGIYFDMVLLKDFRMGLLLKLFSPDKLLPKLKQWNIRPKRTWSLPYDDIGYTDKQLSEMYLDKNNHYEIFDKAPDTIFIEHFERIIGNVLSQNSKCKYTNKPIICVNTYPIEDKKITKVCKKIVSLLSHSQFDIQMMCIDPKNFPEQCLYSCDVFILDDFAIHTKSGSTLYDPLFNKNEMFSKSIIAVYQIDDEHFTEVSNKIDIWDPEQFRNLAKGTELILDSLCDFTYTWFPIPIPDGSDPYPSSQIQRTRTTQSSSIKKKPTLIKRNK